MKKLFTIALLSLAVGCGDDGGNKGDTCGSGTVEMNGVCVVVPPDGGPGPTTTFVQIEHLARPGINEALLITEAFNNGYNATAPTFAGVDPTTLNAVVTEAKTVLRAVYLGVCLVNGVAGITDPTKGLKPGGITCHALGPAVFEADGATQTAASVTASQAYADAVFGLFIPDVMRVDTAVTSNYETLCGAGPVGLCGGRFLSDDVIDVTYDFLLNGAQTPSGAQADNNQFAMLVSDGVVFNNATGATNTSSRTVGDPTNKQQGHPAVSQGFPYSANPF